jgi:hypothetical protein
MSNNLFEEIDSSSSSNSEFKSPIEAGLTYLFLIGFLILMWWMTEQMSSALAAQTPPIYILSWFPYVFLGMAAVMIIIPIVLLMSRLRINLKTTMYVLFAVLFMTITFAITYVGLSSVTDIADLKSGMLQINQALLLIATLIVLIYSVSPKLKTGHKEIHIITLLPIIFSLISMQIITLAPSFWEYSVVLTDLGSIFTYIIVIFLLADLYG